MDSNCIHEVDRGRVCPGREVGEGGRGGWLRVSTGASTSYRAHRSGGELLASEIGVGGGAATNNGTGTYEGYWRRAPRAKRSFDSF